MNKNRFIILAAVLFGFIALLGCTSKVEAVFPNPPAENGISSVQEETAVFAGGCFWGVEGVFENLKGVRTVLSGYSGGEANTAQYEVVSTGTTGHAESVEVFYNPKEISYGTLLKVFFSIAHNPTELNYQGPDYGTQYRSVIFYKDDTQKNLAKSYISILNKARVYLKPIVTEVVPLKAFYPAEEYHQQFMRNNPDYPYIVMWDLPKLKALNQTYPELVK